MDTRGRLQPMYELTIDQARQVLVRESKSVRRAVINVLNEMAEQIKTLQEPQVPTNFADALRLALHQQEQLEAQQHELTQARCTLISQNTYINEIEPKASKWDKFLDSEGYISMKTLSDILKMGKYDDKGKFKLLGRNTLMQLLREKKVLTLKNATYQKYSKYFVTKINEGSNGTMYYTTYSNAKGLDFIA